MSFHPQAIVRGNQVRKPCPVCETEMVKDCNADETKWFWQCQNDDCGHREDA